MVIFSGMKCAWIKTRLLWLYLFLVPILLLVVAPSKVVVALVHFDLMLVVVFFLLLMAILPLNTIEEGGVASTLLQHLAPSVNYARNQAMWPMIAISDTTMVFKGTRLLL